MLRLFQFALQTKKNTINILLTSHAQNGVLDCLGQI